MSANQPPPPGPGPYGYGSGGSQPPGQQPPFPPSPAQQPPPSSAGGFFSALFDLSFSKFITITFAKVIYVLAIALIALTWLLFIIGGFVGDEAWFGVLALLFGWIPGLLYIVLIRVGIEVTVATIRTAINTGDLVQQQRR